MSTIQQFQACNSVPSQLTTSATEQIALDPWRCNVIHGTNGRWSGSLRRRTHCLMTSLAEAIRPQPEKRCHQQEGADQFWVRPFWVSLWEIGFLPRFALASKGAI